MLEYHSKLPSQLVSGPHNRLRAWDDCFTFFQTHLTDFQSPQPNFEVKERAERELACYLAIFGMYRPSGALLNTRSHIYKPILESIFKKAIVEKKDNKHLLNVVLFFNLQHDLVETIRKSFFAAGKSIKKDPVLLSQKILMGIFGSNLCFDINVKNGMKILKAFDKFPNKEYIAKLNCGSSLQSLKDWDEFLSLSDVISFFSKLSPIFIDGYFRGEYYPLLRTVDLFLYGLGETFVLNEKEGKIYININQR